jgi:hypothetical protein
MTLSLPFTDTIVNVRWGGPFACFLAFSLINGATAYLMPGTISVPAKTTLIDPNGATFPQRTLDQGAIDIEASFDPFTICGFIDCSSVASFPATFSVVIQNPIEGQSVIFGVAVVANVDNIKCLLGTNHVPFVRITDGSNFVDVELISGPGIVLGQGLGRNVPILDGDAALVLSSFNAAPVGSKTINVEIDANNVVTMTIQ